MQSSEKVLEFQIGGCALQLLNIRLHTCFYLRRESARSPEVGAIFDRYLTGVSHLSLLISGFSLFNNGNGFKAIIQLAVLINNHLHDFNQLSFFLAEYSGLNRGKLKAGSAVLGIGYLRYKVAVVPLSSFSLLPFPTVECSPSW